MKPNISLRFEIRLGILLLCTVLPLRLTAQVEPKQSATPTPEALGTIRENSLKLLRNIVPVSTSGRALKTVESAGGLVYWGNLFDPREVVALVDLPPEDPSPDYSDGGVYDKFDYEQTWIRHLCFCAWEKDHWVFRQYLDNARNLEFHDRKDKPRHFVQASRKTGRYEGDHLSWFYDEKGKKLVPTNFEDWGPFYLVGEYLVTSRGFERLAHEDSRTIFKYKNGVKGEEIASYWEKDDGRFSFAYKDSKTGKSNGWQFDPKDETGAQYIVSSKGKSAEITVEGTEAGSSYFFELLTGLRGELLDQKWLENLPKQKPLKRIAIKATGDPEIVESLQWPSKNRAAK
jgi:hypothetical protein